MVCNEVLPVVVKERGRGFTLGTCVWPYLERAMIISLQNVCELEFSLLQLSE